MKEQFIERKFTPKSATLIEQANSIIAEYMGQGLAITLRQLYYRFVAAALIPNTMRDYKRLGSVVNDARMAGLIDWDAIVDRTRNTIANSHWATPARILDSCVHSYANDKWRDQPTRVEVWIEKEALAGVFEPVTEELDVTLFPCRGYTSQSEMYASAKRLARYSRNQRVVVLHFGDHDPSGIDMTRDIVDRLELMSGVDLDVERIALNMDQIEEYGPPPNPAKVTDARFEGYEAQFGTESWELDALDPSVLADLIREHVTKHRDDDLWDEAVAKEERGRARLAAVRDAWDAENED